MTHFFLQICLLMLTSISTVFAGSRGALPAKILNGSSSVFRMIPLGLGDTGEDSTADQRREKLAGVCLAPESFIVKLRCDFMRDKCPREGSCKIPYLASGTAFVVGDGATLITAFHVAGAADFAQLQFLGASLVQYPKAKIQNLYAGYEPAFLLYDSDDNLVYDSREYSDAHVFESVGDPLAGFARVGKGRMPARLLGVAKDFAQIRLRKSLGAGLPVKTPDRHDKVFWAVGFPRRTEGRELNYDGFNFYANEGRRLTMEKCGRDFHFRPNASERNFPLLYFGNDIVEGFSGGPIFNEAGLVIGIIAATLSTGTAFAGASFGVPWQDFSPYLLRGPGVERHHLGDQAFNPFDATIGRGVSAE